MSAERNGKVTVVVLRWRVGMTIDIVPELTGHEASAEVIRRAMIAGKAEWPLLEAVTSEVPRERFAEFSGEPSPATASRPPPVVPAKGLIHAVAGYVRGLTPGKGEVWKQRDELLGFFKRHEIELTLDWTGEPD